MKPPARHIAIIMDGNGRWAKRRNHARVFGHIRGVKRVREITEECVHQGVEALTLYTFSTENWQRPQPEIDTLMKILYRYLQLERGTIMRNNIRLRYIGFIDNIPGWVRTTLDALVQESANNTGMFLTLALSYGSRQEITEVIRGLVAEAANGRISPSAITEELVASRLFTRDLPEPDLLIRTGGEQRVSNFLLWQLAYCEFHFTQTPWPEFYVAEFRAALSAFAQRERRFGLTSQQVNASDHENPRGAES